ncbi:hypothetical protein BH18ACT17_BH18ACT17_06870 [soil metagenome]
MGTVLVLAIAVGVGVLVYRLTAGGGEVTSVADPVPPATDDDVGRWAGGEVPSSGSAGSVATRERREAPEGYIQVSPGSPSWNSRLGGAMGLVIAVAVGAIALALSLWALVSVVARLFSDAGGTPAT